MKKEVNLNKIYKISDDVVAREVGGEFVIIPITAGIGDLDDEIFSLNESGRAIWERLDGRKTLEEVAQSLYSEYEGSIEEIKSDVVGIANELLKRRMLVECPSV